MNNPMALTPLLYTVQAINETSITAADPQGKVILLPKESVYGTPRVGETLHVVGIAQSAEDGGTTALAARMLEELLNPPRA